MAGVVDFPLAGTVGATLKPKRYDIEVYQDDSFEFTLTLSKASVPTNVTGWTGLCQVKKADNTLLGTAVITFPTPPSGVVNINFDSVTGEAAGEYKYDVQLTDSGGKKRTFIGGKFTITEDVSE